ncbi:hypothetical protein [Paracoccus albus]|nr:hypothetical protein [Paracoccus albus]WBU59009.1 hypothetical protein PAF20_09305 [Paracoccus albus]
MTAIASDDFFLSRSRAEEGTHPVEMQHEGWQAILDNVARFVEQE